MKRGKKSFIHLKEVIDDLFTSSALSINLDDVRIWEVWDHVVGKRVAKHARPSQINKGVLVVKTPFAHERAAIAVEETCRN